jgi:hypothetical protein
MNIAIAPGVTYKGANTTAHASIDMFQSDFAGLHTTRPATASAPWPTILATGFIMDIEQLRDVSRADYCTSTCVPHAEEIVEDTETIEYSSDTTPDG